MQTGALTSYFDVAQLTLYAFWIFFAGLIFYLRREDKREGYPLLAPDRPDEVQGDFFPPMPNPKTFLRRDGSTYTVPNRQADTRELRATPTGVFSGAPLQPTGNAMLDGVGPAAYAAREEAPELTLEGRNRIVPMRVATDFSVEPRDPDPRGMEVLGADGQLGGVVRDLWIDRSEPQIRYLEVEVAGGEGAKRVLVPYTLVRVRPAKRATGGDAITARVRSGRGRQVRVKSILARQFAEVPGLQNADQITMREEDRITAYYAGGYLYAMPSRAEPIL